MIRLVASISVASRPDFDIISSYRLNSLISFLHVISWRGDVFLSFVLIDKFGLIEGPRLFSFCGILAGVRRHVHENVPHPPDIRQTQQAHQN